MNTKEILDITVKSIAMQPPIEVAENSIKRQSQTKGEKDEEIISFESFLRRKAYKNTTIKTDEAFFDDSDMRSEYFLIVVFDKISHTPLLSARYYFDKSLIAKYLKGDNNSEIDPSRFDLDSYPDGKIFLADRLSGNVSSSIYRKNRNHIFSLYYSEIQNSNRNCTILLMVRTEKLDKQLSKYLSLGFTLVGTTLHKGREHNIILRNLFK